MVGAFGLGQLLKKVAPERFHQMITYGAIVVGVATMMLVSNWDREERRQDQIKSVILQEAEI